MLPQDIVNILNEILGENKTTVLMIWPQQCCDSDEGRKLGNRVRNMLVEKLGMEGKHVGREVICNEKCWLMESKISPASILTSSSK